MKFSICLFRLLSNTMFTQEWDKFKVAFVLQGKPHFVEEDDKVINTKVCSVNLINLIIVDDRYLIDHHCCSESELLRSSDI